MAQRTQPCAFCGTPFTTNHGRKIYCARKCACAAMNAKHGKHTTPRPKVCLLCGESFTPLRKDGLYCSVDCSQRANRLRRAPVITSRECPACGKEFTGATNRPVYCSLKCRTAARYDRTAEDRRRKTREWTQLNKHTAAYKQQSAVKFGRRRAQKLGSPHPLTQAQWQRTLKRANGVCFYCGATESDLTLDHVVPPCRGGAHSEGNTVAACSSCNCSKGGKLLIEWRIRKGELTWRTHRETSKVLRA
ncbi:HNH endonuclease [Gordonia alkanivorans]|uniref:HNH nuclease domain-containing protein n=2 Tax=root TaxID=1 RepID=A0A159B6G8_9CAUD|nr:HNH endonuclease [Gordonia alkanivorans]YP_009324472.1 HNH endonuclease [Gordonia phage GAL1]AKJ72095.1 hypothetical protein GAL1_80 [Gordonia phage GAL1]GAA13845.1 hypothetical protein GOALK_093_00330 [Gordonia alkanivorans NBRC 16433]